MPIPQIKPGLAGIFLGLVSTALLVNSPIVHPQENAAQPSATQSEGGGGKELGKGQACGQQQVVILP